MKIPQMFYLRQVKVKISTINGKPLTVVLFAYYNYRRSVKGVIEVPAKHNNPRDFAKQAIYKLEPEAEFFR